MQFNFSEFRHKRSSHAQLWNRFLRNQFLVAIQKKYTDFIWVEVQDPWWIDACLVDNLLLAPVDHQFESCSTFLWGGWFPSHAQTTRQLWLQFDFLVYSFYNMSSSKRVLKSFSFPSGSLSAGWLCPCIHQCRAPWCSQMHHHNW